MPAVLTIQLGINTPRYASLRSIKQAAAKPIEVKSLADLNLSAGDVGASGSHSRVRRMYIPDNGRAHRQRQEYFGREQSEIRCGLGEPRQPAQTARGVDGQGPGAPEAEIATRRVRLQRSRSLRLRRRRR